MGASLSIAITQGSQSVANNQTYVTATVKVTATGATYNGYDSQCSGSLSGTFSGSWKKGFSKGTTTTLYTKSAWVSHNAEGKCTVSFSASYTTGTSAGTITASNSKTLTTIARTSDLSISVTSIPADGSTTMTATATKKASSFTDTITVTFGDYSKTVTSGTAFSIPKSWNNNMPSTTSGTATVKVTTKSGSTTVGSNSKSLTITVPSSVKPSVSGITVTDTNATVNTAFPGVYLSKLSKPKFEISASGAYGSTITKYSTTFNSKTYTSSSFTASNLTAKSYDVVTTVTDSRSRTGTYTKTITVVEYNAPTLTDIDIIKCDDNGDSSADGTASKITVVGTVSSVNDLNTKSLQVKMRKKTETEYTTRNATPTSWSFTEEEIFTGLQYPASYEYIVTLTDKLNTVTKTVVVGLPTISRYAGGGGLTLFDNASEQSFIVGNNMPAYFTGDFLMEDSELETLMSSL